MQLIGWIMERRREAKREKERKRAQEWVPPLDFMPEAPTGVRNEAWVKRVKARKADNMYWSMVAG